jgi:hypothetical protein
MGDLMSSVIISGDTSGAITLAAPSVAGTNTLTLPAVTGTVLTNKSTGTVLQVVQGTVVTTSTATSSSTFVTTGITASITPSSVSSKILVFANTALDNSASGRSGFFTIYRNSTNVVDSGSSSGNGFNGVFADASRIQTALSVTFLDAPATTSATTYTIYIRSASGSIVANQSCSGYVTVMEIAG